MTLEASNNIKFSIIIPTKNNGNITARCLDSIRELGYPEDKIEVIS
jgi:glycosyltransferase involved in cell wall biosynthesis